MFENFAFADVGSKVIARGAVSLIESKLNGAFVVVGPPGSGKTRLIREIIGHRQPIVVHGRTDRIEFRLLEAIPIGSIVFEDCSEVLQSSVLLAAVSSSHWKFRALGSSNAKEVENKVVVFVTCLDESLLTEDVMRRFSVILLKHAQGSRQLIDDGPIADHRAGGDWTPAEVLPDADLTVLGAFPPPYSEPVWPCFHDGEVWRDVDGAAFRGQPGRRNGPPTHWRNFPEGPAR